MERSSRASSNSSLTTLDPRLLDKEENQAISLMALVSSGRTSGSESMGKQAMGPFLL
eukprot:CAMPEP_0184438526 /NCGR_PEP_ID=MMETSP0738-20130409/655880_1 /TAXON_ID=385413 /ORGANISM="Thalassiosira miniscula, Strain CCMP1093" /LENGTH=56 /DNA_ID=CAMNT_0026805877 /DNA_START=390 /DNA_END=560 /DNA_ORIENTATION=+